MGKVIGVLFFLGAVGFLRGAILYGARRWWQSRHTPKPEASALGQPTPVGVEVEVFQRGTRRKQLAVVSRARHWIAALYAAAGPLSWPVLAWRYGARSATWWCLPALVAHLLLFRWVVSEGDGLYLLGLVPPVLYFLLAHRIASRDHERRTASLLRGGWQSLGRSMVPVSSGPNPAPTIRPPQPKR